MKRAIDMNKLKIKLVISMLIVMGVIIVIVKLF